MRPRRPILSLLAFMAPAMLAAQPAQLSDDEIKARLVLESMAAYSGSCPCPESRNRSGNRCGGNSAYSKPGGSRPLCYPSDVSEAMVKAYRERPSTR